MDEEQKKVQAKTDLRETMANQVIQQIQTFVNYTSHYCKLRNSCVGLKHHIMHIEIMRF